MQGKRYFRLWLPALLRKSSLFFLVNTLFIFFLYSIGSYQKFTDSTQVLLLAGLNYTMILAGLSSLFSALAYIYTIPYRKKNVLFKIILSLLVFTFTLIFYILINFIQSWF